MQALDLILPPTCAGCGTAGAVFCASCHRSLRPPADPRDRFVTADAGVVLGDALQVASAAFVYEGYLRRALGQLKYAGVYRVASALAPSMLPHARSVVAIAGPAVLVPVPIHAERMATRGFNQATLIAREVGRALRLPVAEPLERARTTEKQHRLNRAARLANLRGAFVVRGPVPPAVILVDDIITTAATLEACASVLRDGGCRAVYGLAVAREV